MQIGVLTKIGFLLSVASAGLVHLSCWPPYPPWPPCDPCLRTSDTMSHLETSENWDSMIDPSFLCRPTRWSTSEQDWVVIANPPRWGIGFPSELSFADVVVRAHGAGTDVTGSFTIIPGGIHPVQEFSIVALEEVDLRLEIKAEREGEVAMLVVDGPSSDDYEGLMQEAEDILAAAEANGSESDPEKGSGVF